MSGNVVPHRGQAERQMLWGLDLIPLERISDQQSPLQSNSHGSNQ